MKNHKKQQKYLTQAQILKKIQKSGVSSSQQYQQIIQNLTQQGLRLLNDRQQLKIRVDILLEKQKKLLQEQRQQNGKNNKNGIDYVKLKKQLQDKYRQFQNWQKRCYNSINKGALNIQVKNHLNQCAVIEAEITKCRKLLADEKKQFRKYQKSIKIELKHMNKNVPQRQTLQQQNKQIRKMIWNMRIQQDLTGHVQVRLHNSIVSLQNKKKFMQRLQTMTIQDIRRQQGKSKMQIINQQIKYKKMRNDSIRRLKTQSRISTQKQSSLEIYQQQSKLIAQQKRTQINQKQLQNSTLKLTLQSAISQKSALLLQQNKLAQKLLEQQKRIQQKLMKNIKPQVCDVTFQVNQYQDQQPLPIQVVGNETLLMQDDRYILKNSKDTVITGLVVYQNRIGIASIRALYSNQKQTKVLPPQDYLTKYCKSKKVILTDQKDYLKWFKVYYDTIEHKLVRLEVYSNNKIKFEIGKQKQVMFKNVMAYKFDNNAFEIPVCIRASYKMEDHDWVVASFGIQVNSK